MDDLVRWLGEQLDEDERIARAAAGLQADPENGWGISGRAIMPHIGVVHEDEARAHIAAHNPSRVLREIDAKRQIVDRYAWLREHGDTGGTAWVLPLLALPYAHRPGYRAGWAPTT